MDIRISKESEVPIHEQVAAQIVLLIGTSQWKPGKTLPSVRELARRLKIHHNTVSRAYQDLVLQKLVARRRGIRLVVSSPDEPQPLPDVKDLDELINETIQAAMETWLHTATASWTCSRANAGSASRPHLGAFCRTRDACAVPNGAERVA